MDTLGNRIRRVVEGMMGNESLGDGLETEAAQSLFDWGLSLAKGVAAETGSLDDQTAETAMASRLKSARKLIRSVSRWIAGRDTLSETDREYYWGKIVEHAEGLYGDRFSPSALEQVKDAAGQVTPAELVNLFRELIEKPSGGENA
jgi:hypothetical protein